MKTKGERRMTHPCYKNGKFDNHKTIDGEKVCMTLTLYKEVGINIGCEHQGKLKKIGKYPNQIEVVTCEHGD